MNKIFFSSLVVIAVASCHAYAKPVPGTWIMDVDKAATPTEFEEFVTLTGPANSTQTWQVQGTSECAQTGGDNPSTAPWTFDFAELFTYVDLYYQVSGHIGAGQSSVTVRITGEKALNADGASAWQGWYYNNGGSHENSQIRKIQWKFYDLPMVAN